MARRGRKPKSGQRHPCGRLKQPSKETVVARKAIVGKPTAEVLTKRRELLGRPDATIAETRAAENPLDCMVARGWLEPSLAHAGHAYAELYRRAGLHAAKVTAAIEEAPETAEIDTRLIRNMTPEEIAAVWAVLERRGGEGPAGLGDEVATRTLKTLWTGLGPSITAELYSVCVLNSWPFWAMQKVAGREDHQIANKWIRRRGLLVDGLMVVRAYLNPPKKPGEPERDHPFLGGPIVEEEVQYVDEEGLPDPVTTRSGREVVVVRRRRA